MSNYGNVTSLSESPLAEGLLYAGTDDGLVQVTEDGGANWRPIDLVGDAPAESFINDIKADLFDIDTVYVVLDNHKRGDLRPYVMKSTDRGRSWISIAGDLPDRHIVWRIVQDHERPELLFVGTEFGVFFTVDGGHQWIKLLGGVPNIPFRDLVIQKRENDLVGATFGRSFFVLDDYTPLRQVTEEMLEREVTLFPVRDAWWYIPRRTLGDSEKASQGAAFYTAPNPPFGAVITYYLSDGYKTEKAQRQEEERKIAKEGGDTPYPGWDALAQQEREEEPSIVLTVRDQSGAVIRRLQGPASAGFHRVAWDLRYPPTDAVTSLEPSEEEWLPVRGPLAPPGRYSVSLAKRVGGQVTPLGEPQTFDVEQMYEGTLAGAGIEARVAFTQEIADTHRQVDAVVEILEGTESRLELIKQALMQSTVGETGLDDEVRELAQRIFEIRELVEGNEVRAQIGEPMPHTITRRLQAASMSTMFSTYGPTPNQTETLAIAQDELAEVKSALTRLVEVDVPALEERFDAAGVPWTPGRGVPD